MFTAILALSLIVLLLKVCRVFRIPFVGKPLRYVCYLLEPWRLWNVPYVGKAVCSVCLVPIALLADLGVGTSIVAWSVYKKEGPVANQIVCVDSKQRLRVTQAEYLHTVVSAAWQDYNGIPLPTVVPPPVPGPKDDSVAEALAYQGRVYYAKKEYEEVINGTKQDAKGKSERDQRIAFYVGPKLYYYADKKK